MTSRVHQLLLDAGLQYVDRGDATVDVYAASGLQSQAPTSGVVVKVWSRPVGATVLDRLAQQYPSRHLLLIAPSFSPATRRALADRGWSWIADPVAAPPEAALRIPGLPHHLIGADTEDVRDSDRVRGRKPWQRSAIVRHLLLGNSWTQAELVAVCDVSQPRVSQVLKELTSAGFVSRSTGESGAARWHAVGVDSLIAHWLETYPGPGGAAPTYWMGLDRITDQAAAAMAVLERELARTEPISSAPPPVASADAAADFVAPYRRSQIAVIYSPVGVDLSAAGLTPSQAEHATVKLVVPTDRSVWPASDNRSEQLAPAAPYALADPLQIMWDLREAGGQDADQAAHAVRQALLDARIADQVHGRSS